MAHIRLGELLIDAGVLKEEQLKEALTIQKETKSRLGDILLESKMITNEELIDALQMQLGIDFIDLSTITVPVELARFVPRNIAKKHCIVPVKLVGDTLYIAMSDPLDFIAQEEVKAISRKKSRADDRDQKGDRAGYRKTLRKRGDSQSDRGYEA